MTRRLEDDTPILPDVIAQCVVEEVERKFRITLSDTHADALTKRQAALYKASADWRKKMRARGNKGRDTLYAFMLHWLAADLKDSYPKISAVLADAAWYGKAL